MPRFVFIGLIIAGVAIAVGGGYYLFTWFGDNETTTPAPSATPLDVGTRGLQPAGDADFTGQSSPDGDDDNDGLLNRDELTWQTDPFNSDTDGDGYLDGEEVTARHDPRIPSPNDALADSSSAAQGPLAIPEPLQANQFFVDNFSASISDENLTQVFENQFTAEQRTPAARDTFIAQQPVTVSLPRPDSALVSAALPTTPALIAQYLAVADNADALANAILYADARYSLVHFNDPAGFERMVDILRSYQDDLSSTEVPEAALSVHQLLLGYTNLLVDTFSQVIEWNDDPVKALVALRQAEAADRAYFPLIRDEFLRLQVLQDQLSSGG